MYSRRYNMQMTLCTFRYCCLICEMRKNIFCRIKGGTVCNPAPLSRKSKKKESMPENKSVLFFFHPYSFVTRPSTAQRPPHLSVFTVQNTGKLLSQLTGSGVKPATQFMWTKTLLCWQGAREQLRREPGAGGWRQRWLYKRKRAEWRCCRRFPPVLSRLSGGAPERAVGCGPVLVPGRDGRLPARLPHGPEI